MSLGLVVTQEPGEKKVRQLGKLVLHEVDGKSEKVFVVDNPTPFWMLMAMGVAECLLVEMLTYGYRRLDYILGGDTYSASVSDVLNRGFTSTKGRPGYVYLHLNDWDRQKGRKAYAFVQSGVVRPLPWVVNSAVLAAERARLKAAAAQAAAEAAAKPVLQPALW